MGIRLKNMASGYKTEKKSRDKKRTIAGGYGSMNYDPATVRQAQKQWIKHHNSSDSYKATPDQLKVLWNIINQKA